MDMTFTSIAVAPIVLAGVAATSVALAWLIILMLRQPLLWRMGIRNMVRRPSQTLLILAGLVLAIVFVTATFGLHDSLASSQLQARLRLTGHVDEVLTGPLTAAQVQAGLIQLRQLPEVQAATAIILDRSSATITTQSGLTVRGIDLMAASPEFDHIYGPLSPSTGAAAIADLRPNDIIVSASLAQQAGLHAGDILHATIAEQAVDLSVFAVLTHDIVLTTGELSINASYPAILMPLATAQHVLAQGEHASITPNAICVKNVGQGGLDDAGPDGSRSRTVTRFLERFFHAAIDPSGHVPYNPGVFIVHPLKPDVVEQSNNFSAIAGKAEDILSPAARQYNYLLPIFTILLVGASILLLVLLILLLAAARRGEIGMSRALGAQRSYIAQMLVAEGAGYAAIALLVGIPLGVGALELVIPILSHLPTIQGGSTRIDYQVWLSGPSIVSIVCIGIVTILGVIAVTSLWISHATIVASLRNLDEPPPLHISIWRELRALRKGPRDSQGQPLVETPARRRARRLAASGALVRVMFTSGLGWLLLAGGISLAAYQDIASFTRQDWSDAIPLLQVILFSVGAGLLLVKLLTWLHVPLSVAQRFGNSFIGLGWIYAGWQQPSFLFAFNPVWNQLPSLLATLLSLVAPLAGVVFLAVTNIDLVAFALIRLLQRVPLFAPISRISFSYPLTFRFRTGVTVTLISLITFLVLLLVVNNVNFTQLSQAQSSTGNFLLEMRVTAGENQQLAPAILAAPRTLSHDIATVARLYHSYGIVYVANVPTTKPMLLHVHGQPPYAYDSSEGGPLIADDAFLNATTMPLLARAHGYDSDQQVWDALRDQPDTAVLWYQSAIPGLTPTSGFSPLSFDVPEVVPEGKEATASYHHLTVIGLMPATAHWRAALVSMRTANTFAPSFDPTAATMYYFQLQPGVDVREAALALNRVLHLDQQGITVQSLDAISLAEYTNGLTLFLTCYLALGIVFGLLAIGVLASRAVLERRQQIGMLRAIGFPRARVAGLFLLESSFVITISVVTGAGTALALANQIASQGTQHPSFPLIPVVAIVLGSYIMAFPCTIWPARQAARLPPAEALRYE